MSYHDRSRKRQYTVPVNRNNLGYIPKKGEVLHVQAKVLEDEHGNPLIDMKMKVTDEKKPKKWF